jgi:hypothetical protein
MQSASINYLPCDPTHYRPKIGLVGCGAITKEHLAAYRTAGYDVAALCDIDPSAAEARRKEFFPEAVVTNDVAALLALPEIEVVDIATHVAVRPPLVRAVLEADKHVLSQKPFVLDLAEGQATENATVSQKSEAPGYPPTERRKGECLATTTTWQTAHSTPEHNQDSHQGGSRFRYSRSGLQIDVETSHITQGMCDRRADSHGIISGEFCH